LLSMCTDFPLQLLCVEGCSFQSENAKSVTKSIFDDTLIMELITNLAR
jgi:hypothetical protein